jgi:hypothetical protein
MMVFSFWFFVEEFMAMKVKIFEEITQPGSSRGLLDGIELKINRWLKDNPEIGIIDIRLAMGAAPSHHGPTNFSALCLMLYKE